MHTCMYSNYLHHPARTLLHVTVSAINMLGNGPPSAPFAVEYKMSKFGYGHYIHTILLSNRHVCVGVTTCPCENASSLTIAMSVLAGMGEAFALMITFAIILKVIVTRSKGNSETADVQRHRSVKMEPTVIYEEVNQNQMAASSEIAVQENSAYGLVSH